MLMVPGMPSFDHGFLLCRYEAAMILRKACSEGLALGNVLQILNMIVSMKKWITHHPSGWQPISITLEETKAEMGAEPGI